MIALGLAVAVTNAPTNLIEFIRTLPHSTNYLKEYNKAGPPKSRLKTIVITNKVEKSKP